MWMNDLFHSRLQRRMLAMLLFCLVGCRGTGNPPQGGTLPQEEAVAAAADYLEESFPAEAAALPWAERLSGLNTFAQWPTPTKLRVLQINKGATAWQILTLAAIQGLVNRTAPEGTMIYFEARSFPDSLWRRYYTSYLESDSTKPGLKIIQTNSEELLDWVYRRTNIHYYIIIDPFEGRDVEETHTATANLATTMSGIFGNAVPVHPDDVPLLEAHGFTLLPDEYRAKLGPGGDKLKTPNAFDLRNQWRARYSDAPWRTRRDLYQWAIDHLLPLTKKRSITLNYGYESPQSDVRGGRAEPWINDYAIGSGEFTFYMDPSPSPDAPWDVSRYSRDFYKRVLTATGPFTMVRGWPGNEMDNLRLISQMRCFHAGSIDMANSSVHAAIGPLFNAPFRQRTVSPDEVNPDDAKVYLTFTVTDGDQFGVIYRGYENNRVRGGLWRDPARGKIPINWTMNGLMWNFGRGILRWYYDNASPLDYFTADLPVGYAWFTHENFGDMLNRYDEYADRYLEKTGLLVADYLHGYSGFPSISSPTVESHVNNLTHAIAVRDGYSGGSAYQGIYWPESRPLFAYIRNCYCAGAGGYSGEIESAKDVARVIVRMASEAPWRPLFIHLTWVNWYMTPSDMLDCIRMLEREFPGQYELVGMPEFVALAQKAKMTRRYPLEFFPHLNGESGQEGPFLWEESGSYTNTRADRDQLYRGTSGNGFFTYKFNVYPAESAAVQVEIEGSAFRMDASPDNLHWTNNVIQGKSGSKVLRNADLTPYLNENHCVYVRFSGKTKLWHVKVEY
jgi:hypothetical protein